MRRDIIIKENYEEMSREAAGVIRAVIEDNYLRFSSEVKEEEVECARVEKAYKKLQKIDLVILGMENIFRGEQVLLLADGEEKEKGLSYFLNGCITTWSPVSLLKLHPNCKCIINKECFDNWEQMMS